MAPEAFRDTLPSHERHFVARFESFGDIVVGFSMSLLALQLTIPHTAAELYASHTRLLEFFGTFALVSVYWVGFHGIMSTGFAPKRTDMFFGFAYLALVALTPYAFLVNASLSHSLQDAYAGLGFYIVVFLAVTICSLVLNVRGAQRAWPFLDHPRRLRAWRRVVMGAMYAACLGVALALDATRNVALAGASLFALLVILPLSRRVPPHPAWMGISEGATGTSGPRTVSWKSDGYR